MAYKNKAKTKIVVEKVDKTFCPIVNAAVDFPSLGCYGCIRPTPQYRLCRPAKVVKINFETRMVTMIEI